MVDTMVEEQKKNKGTAVPRIYRTKRLTSSILDGALTHAFIYTHICGGQVLGTAGRMVVTHVPLEDTTDGLLRTCLVYTSDAADE